VFSFSLSLFVVVVIIIIIISSGETSEPLGQENIIISQVSPPQKKKHGRKPKRWTVGLNTSYKSISAG
jgi:hypothetical protein